MSEEFERFSAQLKGDFTHVKFYVDKAVDHPERYRRAPLWLIDDFGLRRSFASNSRVIQGLDEIGQTRIYADIRGDVATETAIKTKCLEFIRRFAA